MWLKKLHTLYVSKENCETIIDKSTMIIFEKTGKNIEHNNDKLFFEIFNTIASNVFSIESKNPVLQQKTPVQALNIINNIVINEIVNYILIKKPGLLKEIVSKETISKETVKEPVTQQEPVSKEKETIKISIEKSETIFTSPIENVTNINIVALHMYTEDYIITELNNVLVIVYNNEKIKIEIQPGNYTPESLCDTLKNSVMNRIQKIVSFYVSKIDNTLLFSSQYIEISNEEDSTLIPVLGINTGHPIKLLKRNKLQLGIDFSFENEINNFKYSTPLVINNNDTETVPTLKEFKLNYKKKFLYPVDLTGIKIDYDNYNHRGYPYYLMIEIIKLV
jgi:hypothetical protein